MSSLVRHLPPPTLNFATFFRPISLAEKALANFAEMRARLLSVLQSPRDLTAPSTFENLNKKNNSNVFRCKKNLRVGTSAVPGSAFPREITPPTPAAGVLTKSELLIPSLQFRVTKFLPFRC